MHFFALKPFQDWEEPVSDLLCRHMLTPTQYMLLL